MNTYRETIESLIKMMAAANMGDSDDPDRPEWVMDGDEAGGIHDGLYGDLQRVLTRITSKEFVNHISETGEPDWALLPTRRNVKTFSEKLAARRNANS
mgnify:CR=1 FL=1